MAAPVPARTVRFPSTLRQGSSVGRGTMERHISASDKDFSHRKLHTTGRQTFKALLTPTTFSHVVNPFSKTHGAPTDDERHVGDLGNFETDAQGNAKGTITDKQVKLIGSESVLGVRKTLTHSHFHFTFPWSTVERNNFADHLSAICEIANHCRTRGH